MKSVQRSGGRPAAVMTLTCLACLAVGCGPKTPATVPVSGVVLFDDKPLEGASVSFSSAAQGGRNATGLTDASGKFTLTSFKPGDGAPAGKYKVGISKIEAPTDQKEDPTVGKAPAGLGPPPGALSGPPTGKGGGMPKASKSLIPVKYSNPSTSGFEIEVKAGMEPAKLELKSK